MSLDNSFVCKRVISKRLVLVVSVDRQSSVSFMLRLR
jgi:hypothetical protein